MRAIDFVKKYGWEESKELVNAQSWTMRQIALSTTVDTKELTRLVESHELVEIEGGIDEVKYTFSFASKHGVDELTEYGKRLKQAIVDVESCL